MEITNERGIPRVIFLATQADWYSGKDVKKDFSVTELLKPPYMKRLERDHEKELTVEASEQLWTMMGSAMHHIVEQGAAKEPERYIAEMRLMGEFFGKLVSGQMDIYDVLKKEIQDHKYTSVWKYIYRNAPNNDTIAEWTFQLNVYRMLAEQHGYEVLALSINLLFRDFDKKAAKIAEKAGNDNYPYNSSISVPIEILSDDEMLVQIEHKMKGFEEAMNADLEELSPCSRGDRWQDSDKFAVMKQGRKSAVRLLYGWKDAQKYIDTKVVKEKSKHYIEKRPGLPKRCIDYCAVSKYCKFYKAYQEEQLQATRKKNAQLKKIAADVSSGKLF